MTYQQILSYISFGLEYINNKLIFPNSVLQNGLSLKIDVLPQIIRSPVNFALIMLFATYFVFSFANNFICNIIGILYPFVYCLNIFVETPINTEISVTLNKYWMLFCGLLLVDSFFGFLLHLIPGYFYIKVIAIYTLMRNDFTMTNTIFGTLENLYIQSNIYSRMEKMIEFISSKLRNKPTEKLD